MERNMDSLFKELVREHIDNSSCPPKDEIWNNIKLRLMEEQNVRKKEYWRKKLRPLIAACLVTALIASIFLVPGTNAMAFTNRILKSILNIGEDTIHIYKKVFYGNRPEKAGSNNFYDPRINEVQKEVSFKLLVPLYIPEGYELESVKSDKKREKREYVSFLYSSTDSKNSSNDLTIIQQYYPDSTSMTISVPRVENPSAESFIIGSTEYIFVDNNGYQILLWNSTDVGYEIISTGNIGKDEMVRIAESMGHGI